MSSFDGVAAARLAAREAQGLRRSLVPVTGVDFGSNDYLGLRDHPELRRRAGDARAGGAGASRLLSGNTPEHEALETRLARWLGTESALLFGSGWMAATGVASALPAPGDVVFSDELNHASLIDGLRLGSARRVVFPHRDPDALAELMEAHAPADGGIRWIVTESVFSMDGTRAPLSRYARLLAGRAAAMIVDEAHAIGVHGPDGRGLVADSDAAPWCAARVVTFGKALGGHGAAVACSETVRDLLVNTCRPFIFSTAPSPLVVAAADAALDLVQSEPERRARVLELSDRLRGRLLDRGLRVPDGDGPIIPVLLGPVEAALGAARELERAGFFTRAVRPPTVPEGTARIRLSVRATHSPAECDAVADALARAVGAGLPA